MFTRKPRATTDPCSDGNARADGYADTRADGYSNTDSDGNAYADAYADT